MSDPGIGLTDMITVARQAQEVSELEAEQAECQKLYRAKVS